LSILKHIKRVLIILSMEEKNKPQVAIYQSFGDGQKIRVRIEDENVWLTQKLIAELFDVDVRTVNEHLKNIFLEQELEENSVIRNFRITAADNKSYETKHYNLDVILAVGYRVRSGLGTQFRKWATERLREYLIKGFTMDDERLKQGGGRLMKMRDWIDKLDEFLIASEKKLLDSAGTVGAKQAEKMAMEEF
jgi:hypothetical protein